MVETYPWQPSVNVNRLRTLNPDDVGWHHGKKAGGGGGACTYPLQCLAAVRPQHGRMRYLNVSLDCLSCVDLFDINPCSLGPHKA